MAISNGRVWKKFKMNEEKVNKMPIKIPDQLPAAEILKKRKYFYYG